MLEIKPFTPSDLDVVTRLAREKDFAPGVGDIEIYANTDRQGIWLAWLDNEPAGCIAAVTYNPGYAFIGLFVVKSEYQGQGVGSRLWEHALETLNNVECIGLEAAVQRVSFYEKAGFEKDCVTTRRQKMCLSDQSQHPNTTLLRRSDSPLCHCATSPSRRFSDTTNAMRSAQGPIRWPQRCACTRA